MIEKILVFFHILGSYSHRQIIRLKKCTMLPFYCFTIPYHSEQLVCLCVRAYFHSPSFSVAFLNSLSFILFSQFVGVFLLCFFLYFFFHSVQWVIRLYTIWIYIRLDNVQIAMENNITRSVPTCHQNEQNDFAGFNFIAKVKLISSCGKRKSCNDWFIHLRNGDKGRLNKIDWELSSSEFPFMEVNILFTREFNWEI